MQEANFCLWCVQVHNVHSYAPRTALMHILIICVGSVSNAEQCGQKSWCNEHAFVCDVRKCTLYNATISQHITHNDILTKVTSIPNSHILHTHIPQTFLMAPRKEISIVTHHHGG